MVKVLTEGPAVQYKDQAIKMISISCVWFVKFLFFFSFYIIDQLERVFLRLGHAETDEQLQNIISKFLPPVLLKLSSTQEGVRKKVSMLGQLGELNGE